MPLLAPTDGLGFEDEYTFTAFYQPGENDVDRVSRQVLIESNARTPSFFVSFSTCVHHSFSLVLWEERWGETVETGRARRLVAVVRS